MNAQEPFEQEGYARAREAARCYYCGETGHYKAYCPSRQTLPPEETQQDPCYICGQTGHWAIACPLHPAKLRNIRGDACGPGPCTNACRLGDHNQCCFSWCSCRCHGIASMI